MHDVLNELLRTDNSYCKNAEIQPVLDTIHDKMCKFVLQPDDIDEQPLQQQSPDDILKAEEITDKLAEIDDMEELDARSVNNITGLFAALQMCHQNSAKMAGHLALAVLPCKHPTHCLAAIIHTVLQRHLFNSKESTSTISEEFQVTSKKLYEGLTGKWYDPGQKLTKVEKAAQEAAKVTPSTTSATSSTPLATSSTQSATPMDVEHEVPTTQEHSQGAIPKKQKLGSSKQQKPK